MSLTGTPYYASLSDMLLRWGSDTVNQWSDLDGTGSVNTSRVNAALLWADAQIDSEFSAGGIYTVGPGQHLTFGPISSVLTNQWACVIAGVWLYEVRSGRDERYTNNLRPQLDEAMKALHLAASDTKNAQGFDAQRRWPVTNAAVGYCPREIGMVPGRIGY